MYFLQIPLSHRLFNFSCNSSRAFSSSTPVAIPQSSQHVILKEMVYRNNMAFVINKNSHARDFFIWIPSVNIPFNSSLLLSHCPPLVKACSPLHCEVYSSLNTAFRAERASREHASYVTGVGTYKTALMIICIPSIAAMPTCSLLTIPGYTAYSPPGYLRDFGIF